MDTILNSIQLPQLSQTHKQALDAPFLVEEMKEVTFQIGPLKVPSKDGKPGLFYRTYWILSGILQHKHAWIF